MTRIQIRRFHRGDILFESKILFQSRRETFREAWSAAVDRVESLAPAVIGELELDGTFNPIYIRLRGES